MKDWKAAHDMLKGVVAEQQKQIEYYHRYQQEREDRDRTIRDNFKQLLINVLER
jgi:hypothetical protein